MITHATDYARQFLRADGSVSPALFLSVPEGIMVLRFPPPQNIADKNAMAKCARLACLAYPVTACAMVAEAWIVSAKPGRPLDPAIPPSASPDRRECVYLVCESPGKNLTQQLPILRTSRGRFLRLGRAKICPGQVDGRLSHFLPAKIPSPRARAQALKQLTANRIPP